MATVDLCDIWERIVTARGAVLEHLDILLHHPLLAVAGSAALDDAVKDLLDLWERFYGKLAQYHATMHDIDHAWTRLLFEAIAALDVVQIKLRVDANRTSWKAILLPSHPLHLWRYERITALTRGLKPDDMDRSAGARATRASGALSRRHLSDEPPGRKGRQSATARRARLPRPRSLREPAQRLQR